MRGRLALSGAVFQSLTRNPLGSPDIIGFSSGSYTGAIVVMLLLGSSRYLDIAAGALLGGCVTAAVVYLLAMRRGTVQSFRLIIMGIGVGAMLSSPQLRAHAHGERGQRDARRGVGSRFAQRPGP